ncbi:hypothetical protein JTB14_001831 [Gonioctena quinquepunctata]|nr:hypothetical protein JTB14_001831 [Gonioctena quinquepunctata]
MVQADICFFCIYLGSTTEPNEEQWTVFGVGTAVMLKLCGGISEPNINLYFDNFFSNYNLLQYLRRKEIYASCSARQDRFNEPLFPSDKDMKTSGRGTSEEIISQDGEVIMTKWFDNKPVIMASNYMGIGNSDSCRR